MKFSIEINGQSNRGLSKASRKAVTKEKLKQGLVSIVEQNTK